MNAPASPVMDLATQLVALCNEGKNLEAIEKFYSPDIVSIEVFGSDEMPKEMKGIDAIKGKNQWWYENHEVHSGCVQGPFPNGDRFIAFFDYDITPKCGPMEGQRMQMREAGLFTVADGKIVKEEFFYHMGG